MKCIIETKDLSDKRDDASPAQTWLMQLFAQQSKIKKKTCKWIAISALSRGECEGKRQRTLDTRVMRDECVEMRLRVWLNNSSSATDCARRATTIVCESNLKPGMQLACLLLYLIFYLCVPLSLSPYLSLFCCAWSVCLSACLLFIDFYLVLS